MSLKEIEEHKFLELYQALQEELTSIQDNAMEIKNYTSTDYTTLVEFIKRYNPSVLDQVRVTAHHETCEENVKLLHSFVLLHKESLFVKSTNKLIDIVIYQTGVIIGSLAKKMTNDYDPQYREALGLLFKKLLPDVYESFYDNGDYMMVLDGWFVEEAEQTLLPTLRKQMMVLAPLDMLLPKQVAEMIHKIMTTNTED